MYCTCSFSIIIETSFKRRLNDNYKNIDTYTCMYIVHIHVHVNEVK